MGGNSLQLMSSMKQCIEYVHNGNKLCIYTICVYSFKQEYSLLQHKQCVHKSNAPYKCELCHKGFDGDNNFNRHIESVHEENKSYKRNLWNVICVVIHFN